MVLIKKGGGKDFRVIGIVEVLRKCTTGIINRRLTSEIHYHDNLYYFWTGRGTVTTPLEANLLQQVMVMRETVIHIILLDLQKTYDALDQDRCLEILLGYSVGPRTLRILWTYWNWMHMVANAGGYFSPPFKGHHRATQGYPLSPNVFNVVVDAMIRHFATVMAPMEAGAEVLREMIQKLVDFFYVYNSVVASPRPEMLQRAFNVLTDLFNRSCLNINVRKMVIMACHK